MEQLADYKSGELSGSPDRVILSQARRKFKDKLCRECGTKYNPTGPAARYCNTCADSVRRRVSRKSIDAYRLRNGVKVGVGKGGNNAKGTADSQYKHGISDFMKFVKLMSKSEKHCERCYKDLTNADSKSWATHHRDHSRLNNSIENFEILCKRCHQLEHECWTAFSKVQRPSSNGVGNSVPEAPDTPLG